MTRSRTRHRTGLPGDRPGDSWVRLRTLILLRWVAISGQISAIVAAQQFLGLEIPLGPAFLAIGASVAANLVATFIFAENKRLSETETLYWLLFDLAQLAILLCLTGGLNNPFAFLIVVPVTISATALGLRATVILGLAAILMTLLAALLHVPLRHADGTAFQVPALFEIGFGLSIAIGVVFLALYSGRVAAEIRSMADALLATQMALAREQKLTDLGGVVAAAAHELGTPLATIKLVSTELIDELEDQPDLRADAELVRDQADRCRDILRSMGRAGKDDRHLRRAPLEAVVREAAEPHRARGKEVRLALLPGAGADPQQPDIQRSPEIVHGLRNLVQNAVDFAAGTVWIDLSWTADEISIRIADDGPGFPPHLIGRIGDPFVRSRRGAGQDPERPGYEGMGLGLFIAKTLLERSGAELTFSNGSDPFLAEGERTERCGARVEVTWPDASLRVTRDGGLGANPPVATL